MLRLSGVFLFGIILLTNYALKDSAREKEEIL